MEQLILVSAEFYHFKGFANSNIKHLKVRFEEALQILNSTNGTGKTTFMLELNPKTIDKELFDKDGFKRLIYQNTNKNGEEKHYELYSSHKHNRFIDLSSDVNLNDGNTITQYNTLLREIFNVTPYTWNIAMGTIPFTSLDKNERRKWIETISGVDFGYAFDVYDKIVKRITGVKHSLKLLTNDLVAAEERVIDSNEIKDLEVSKGTLVELSNDLMRLSDSQVDIRYKETIERKLTELKTKALAQSKQLERGWYRNDAPNGVTSVEALMELQRKLEDNIALVDHTLTTLTDNLADKEALLTRVHDINGLSLDEINQQYSQLISSKTKLQEKIENVSDNEYLRLFSDETSVNTVKSIQDNLLTFADWCFIQEQFNDDACQYPFSTEQYKLYQGALHKSLQQIAIYNTRQDELEQHVDAVKSGKEITCPNCQHLFVDGVNKLDSLRNKWKELNTAKQKEQRNVNDYEELVKSYEETEHNLRGIKTWLNDAFNHKRVPYLHYLLDKVESGTSLRTIVNHITKVGKLIPLLLKMYKLEDELSTLSQLKQKFEAVNAVTDTEALEKEVELLRDKVITKREELTQLKEELTTVSQYHRKVDNQLRLSNEHLVTLKMLYEYKLKYGKVINEMMAKGMLGDVQEKLAVTASKLNANESTVTLTKNLKSMIERQEQELALLGDLHKAMSPNGGIIAEQLTGYCTTFANKLTEVLDMVWGYEMKIRPCVNKKGTIDYKFPIQLEKGIVSDIAKGSKAMRGIINLAVMICTRSALGLTHLPMFLDEVGEGLDVTHNEKLRTLIRKLLKGNQCSMVFFVDHDVNNRSSLGDYDEIVFNANQVVTGEDYNQYVEITHY